MPLIEAILAILDSRSFGSIWFWLLLALAWSLLGRKVAGVPYDIAQAVRRKPALGACPDADDPDGLLLLDWLSLTLPRRRLGRVEGVVLLFIATFVLTALVLLGFFYGLEMAQALVLLLLPFAALAPLEIRLAERLSVILHDAATKELPLNLAAAQAARLMQRHRLIVTLMSVAAVAITGYRAAIWFIANPFGF